MINIGLIGESPYDTKAIKHLLLQNYNEQNFRYTVLLKNITGDHLRTPKATKAAIREVEKNKPDLVIVMIDADAFETNKDKISKKKDWYKNLSKQINRSSLLLLNIYELEALILADIAGLNTYYGTNVKFKGNVSLKENPKEYLKRETSRYEVSHCPELFNHLNFEVIRKNCDYFNDFIIDFEKALKIN